MDEKTQTNTSILKFHFTDALLQPEIFIQKRNVSYMPTGRKIIANSIWWYYNDATLKLNP